MITVVDLKFIGVRVLFALQFIVCAWVYWYGTHGLGSLLALRQECQELRQEITDAKKSIESVQEEIIAWNAYSFYKEKMARELNMARKGEIVYHVN